MLCLILLPAVSRAQETVLSVHAENRPLHEVLDMVERQTSFSFVYDASQVDVGRGVTVFADGKNLFDVLNGLFAGTGIAWTVMNRQIILTHREAPVAPQQKKMKAEGRVKDRAGEAVIGANVVVKGTRDGTVTDADGRFAIEAPLDSTILISYMGYLPQEIVYIGQKQLDVTLAEDSRNLDEVVVTALGIRKKESTLPYATETFRGVELTRVKDPNLMNALSGKIAGVEINRNSSGPGGSTRVTIRGERSVSGNNQPLYVIDGIPILSTPNEQANTALGGPANSSNRDSGDGISNLNQDDIESVNVLKGAAASALYGSQAANGVILITTKSGRAGLKRVEFSSNVSFDHVVDLPQFQDTYGRTEGAATSWGGRASLTQYDNLKDYFRTGAAANNSISFTSGTDNAQAYFSYANTTARGLTDNNRYRKHNLSFRQKAQFFGGRLALDGNVILVTEETRNRPTPGGIYLNPLAGLYTFPRGMDITPYRENYETYDAERNMPVQNWYIPITDQNENPYWLLNRTQGKDTRKRAIASVTAEVKPAPWLSIQARGSMDYDEEKFRKEIYATTSSSIAGANGRFIDYRYDERMLYGDVMASATWNWQDVSLHAVAGASITDNRENLLRLDSRTASLYYPNVFTVSNIRMTTDAYLNEEHDQRRQLQSAFSTVQLGYKERIYLDLSARNDWGSTLAFTKSKNSGFFYPSAGVGWMVDKTLALPQWVSMGKVRASWSKVGNDLPVFVSSPVSHIGAGGSLVANDTAPFGELKPEMTTSIEAGTAWSFFRHRLSLDLTLYQTNTRNQLFRLPSSAGAAYKYYYANAGNIRNRGIEVSVDATPVLGAGFTWKTSLNFTLNRNRIVRLHEELPVYNYSEEGFTSSYSMRLVEGGSFGDIYGRAFERGADGSIRYGNDGMPLTTTESNTVKVGNRNPDFLLGWSHTFRYKDFSLYMLIDGRFGGDVLSQTQAILDQYGVSAATGEARDRGYVELEGTRIEDVQRFYERIGGRDGVTEYYMYDATNIRLRELSVGYTYRNLSFSVVARNLFYFYKNPPFDPDLVLSTGNNNQGIDIFGMPATRSIGLNFKASF